MAKTWEKTVMSDEQIMQAGGNSLKGSLFSLKQAEQVAQAQLEDVKKQLRDNRREK